VQFTPDLLPSDITGTHVFDQKTGDFLFRQGPVFTQVLLADEINRATPRTQSALLEAMEEKQVTAEGESMALPKPFLVLATQNPIELEGTFPLPEAQLDRFLLRVRMGYPTEEEDAVILDRFMQDNPIEELVSVLSAEDLISLQASCREVTVEADVREYISKLTQASRNHPEIELGASPRAMLGLLHASQALAAVRGRSYVIPDDVKELVPAVFGHRISLQAQSNLRGDSVAAVLKEIVDSVATPVEQQPAVTAASGD
jgi:MoxR-like ATPase